MLKPILVSDELNNKDLFWSKQDKVFLKVLTTDEARNYQGKNKTLSETEVKALGNELSASMSLIRNQNIRADMFEQKTCLKCEVPIIVIFDN